MVDAHGGSATFTGSECIPWAGGRTADGVAVQGNLLAGASVVDAAFETFAGGGLPFPELLLRALKAGDDAGGDRRGRQSAALLVVRENGGYGGNNDRWIDLRVDDHVAPIDELGRLLELNHLYLDRPDPADLLAIDETLAGQLRSMLTAVDYSPDTAAARRRAGGGHRGNGRAAHGRASRAASWLGRIVGSRAGRVDVDREPRGAFRCKRLDRPTRR